MSDQKNSEMVELSQSRIVRYVFNYNALESISLVISTCILLVGMVRNVASKRWRASVLRRIADISVAPPPATQIFSSKALSPGSFFYWLLIIFVGTTIVLAIVVMAVLVMFESYRAFKYSKLYEDVRWGL